MPRPLFLLLLLLVVVGAAAGCHRGRSALELAARARARVALRCPDERLSVAEIGGGGWDALGCGLHQTYTCVDTRGSGVVCSPDGAPSGTYQAPPPGAFADASPDGARILEAASACQVPPYTTLHVGVGAVGDILVFTADPPGPETACVEHRLNEGHFESRRDLEYIDVTVPAPATTTTVAAEIIPSAPVAATGSDAEAAARATVVRLRDDILACTGATTTAVVAEWAADGALTVRLPDARAGTPEDGCVRAAANGARLDPAPGTAGSVLHAVQ